MFKKQLRLTGKDVRFLTKKRNYISAGMFWFFFFEQYANRKFNQFSIFITVKLDKRAVKRRIVKKIMQQYLEREDVCSHQIKWRYYKIFVVLQKNCLQELKEKIASWEKKSIISYVGNNFISALSLFKKRIQ